jgi:hypothetical protein
MSITRSNIVYPPSGAWSIPDNVNPKLYKPNIAKYGNEHTIAGRKEQLHYPPDTLQDPLTEETQKQYKAEISHNNKGQPIITHQGKALNDFDFVAIITEDDTLFVAPREDNQGKRMTHQILAMGQSVKHPFSMHLTDGRIKSKHDLMYESGHYKPNEGLTYLLFDKMKIFIDDTPPSNLEGQRVMATDAAISKGKKHDDADYLDLIKTPPLSPVSSINDLTKLTI